VSDLVRFLSDNAALVRRLGQRSRLLSLLRGFFLDRGFVEAETPILCASPGVEVHLSAFETAFGRRRLYLTTSPEFHMKRLVAVGMKRVFQVTRAFRSGESGDRHNPEFTMVEWYRAGEDYRAIVRDCEDLLAQLAWGLLGKAESPPVPGTRPAMDLSPDFRRTTFDQAFRRAGVPDWDRLPLDDRFRVLAERVEPRLGVDRPEFLLDYPPDQASLARVRAGSPPVAERFELYAAGLELANGWTELTDADEYVRRCREDLAERSRQGLPLYPVDERYVSMLRDGLPPCAGVALGFDRVAMLLTGATRIDEVIAFPIDLA
jgi:lysyl-tRNA synthetase class 2